MCKKYSLSLTSDKSHVDGWNRGILTANVFDVFKLLFAAIVLTCLLPETANDEIGIIIQSSSYVLTTTERSQSTNGISTA